MVEKTPETNRDGQGRAEMSASAVEAWFVREVLPLEAVLMQFLHRNWRNKAEIPDLRQDVYVRVFAAALETIPDSPKSFLLTTARNLIIDRVRRDNVIPIEAVADFDLLNLSRDEPGPERHVMAREELHRLQVALDRLPPRCHEAVVLRQIEGLTRREIASRMGITEKTVKRHLADGVRALADMLYGEPSDLRSKP
jgi:RNA polymerase sigma factor (sigma-70 family)